MKNKQEHNYLICYEAQFGSRNSVAGDFVLTRKIPILTSDDIKDVRILVKKHCVSDLEGRGLGINASNLVIFFRSINKLT
jgi:hypothetical protein